MKSSNQQHNVRMLAQLMDLGDGALSVNVAKKVLLDDADGVVARAQRAWESAGLPVTGTVTVEQLVTQSAPRARGDGPRAAPATPMATFCSPRPRGWSPLPQEGMRRLQAWEGLPCTGRRW
ncbi:hypothetical protein [Streptomyces sp. NBC_00829]|uniref:hypothetical protein n=1 Tax=Streptomyces sp. NBC_00829 TaxID=2903679 RepID=UPI00386445BF|nr:hypothetical protein OG293_40140 [Streptomyces sp. NBC_00829]